MSGSSSPWSTLPTLTSIRILYIDSASAEAIKVRLEVVDLKNQPRYDCLSYTWDDPLYHDLTQPRYVKERQTSREQIVDITCNGTPWKITRNLRAALLRLAKGSLDSVDDGFEQQGGLWIDALCIDQKNNEEKGVQIAMMTRIFQSAQTVIVWLGPEDESIESAVTVMERLGTVSRDTYSGAHWPPDLYDRGICETLGIEYIYSWQWLDYAAFLQRTWFGRIWMIQEAFVAREITVLCGRVVLSWSTIVRCALLLHDTGLDSMLSAKAEGKKLDNLFIFNAIMRRPETLSMGKIMNYSMFFGATNARDRVFALRAMHKETLLAKCVQQVTVDYNATVEQVYTSATWIALSETLDLRMLSLVEGEYDPSLPRLPSWVPNYGQKPLHFPLNDELWGPPDKQRWNALGGLAWDASVITRESELQRPSEHLQHQTWLPVQGIRIDTVADTGPTYGEFCNEFAIADLLELLKRALDARENANVDNNRRGDWMVDAPAAVPLPAEGFWRGLIKNTLNGRPAGARARQSFPVYIARAVGELVSAIRHERDKTPNPNAVKNLYLADLIRKLARTKKLIDELAPRTDLDKTDEDASSISSGTSDSPLRLPGDIIPSWSTTQGILQQMDEDVGNPEANGRALDIDALIKDYCEYSSHNPSGTDYTVGGETEEIDVRDMATEAMTTCEPGENTLASGLLVNPFDDGRSINTASSTISTDGSIIDPASIFIPEYPGGNVADYGERAIEPEMHVAFDEIERAVEQAYAHRRPFRTQRWNFVGMGPQPLRRGDVVWILAGADVPMVLRRAESPRGHDEGAEGERWTLVGEAYVLGLMEGEAVVEKHPPLESISLV